MATAHDKYVPYPVFVDFADSFRRFVGLTLAVLASVAIGMPSPYDMSCISKMHIWNLAVCERS